VSFSSVMVEPFRGIAQCRMVAYPFKVFPLAYEFVDSMHIANYCRRRMSRITESLLTGRSRAAFRAAISNIAVIRMRGILGSELDFRAPNSAVLKFSRLHGRWCSTREQDDQNSGV